jgi:hypothetical protein
MAGMNKMSSAQNDWRVFEHGAYFRAHIRLELDAIKGPSFSA